MTTSIDASRAYGPPARRDRDAQPQREPQLQQAEQQQHRQYQQPQYQQPQQRRYQPQPQQYRPQSPPPQQQPQYHPQQQPQRAHRGARPRQEPGGDGPYGTRLLAGWYETSRPADLDAHLERYGRMPLTEPPGRHEHPLIGIVEQAGLTGRGGAAFPTAKKMRAVAQASGRGSILVANGMESEPASRKDQTLLKLAPHLVFDGMTLAAQAVGASEAHLCVPRTRERQISRLRAAIAERSRRRLDPIPIYLDTVPHHYVASEASALVNWLNGGDARPTTTPPRTSERGVDGLPTLVDNVETLAHLALIARFGPAWYRSRGLREAPGTTLVTLTGAVPEPGVYEVELGTPVRDVLSLSGPLVEPQAVLLGGYFGTWVPIQYAATLTYSAPTLTEAGTTIGAGLIAVLPRGACGLAETARILDYLAGHSARQCGPCRFGLPATADGFAQLAFGRLGGRDRQRLEDNIALLKGRGACKHPDGASQLAASALRAFTAEVRHHLERGPCYQASNSAGLLPTTWQPIGEEDWQ